METLHYIALIVHITCGFTSLAAGLLAILTPKGQKGHRWSGLVFYWAMVGVSSTALVISAITLNYFLFSIGIFSFFQIYFGYRAVHNKIQKPTALDWTILSVSALNALAMIASLDLVLLVFGLINANLVVGQFNVFLKVIRNKPISKIQWLLQHIPMMLGAYIATLTAFLVVNVKSFEPNWLIWISPSIAGGALIFYYTRTFSQKHTSVKTTATLLLLVLHFIVSPTNLYGQPYVEGGQTRHRFAQLNLGLEYRQFFKAGSESFRKDPTGILQPFQLRNQSDARIVVGGTHFWGHADFYISIPVADLSRTGFTADVETGGKYFPWRIENHKLRPYVGAALLPTTFTQDSGTKQMKFRYPLTAGLVFNSKRHLFELGTGFVAQRALTYYIDKSTAVEVRTPSLWISFSYKFMFETTLGAERDWQSGKTAALTDTLSRQKRLNGFTLAAGPSSAFFLRSSEHNKINVPYLGNHKATKLFCDVGIGYYFHQADLQLNLAWRSMKSDLKAFGFEQNTQRQSLTFEIYKFVSDYHGFAAFVGPAISYEWLHLNERDENGFEFQASKRGLHGGITFGWDIRPNRLQSILLRTNLRYFPLLNLNLPDGTGFSFDQLEFNFIQVVVFPGRLF